MLPTFGLSSLSAAVKRMQSAEQLPLAHLLTRMLTNTMAKLHLLLSGQLWFWVLQVKPLLTLLGIVIDVILLIWLL